MGFVDENHLYALPDAPEPPQSKPIRAGFVRDDAETLLVNIAWEHFTNDEIATYFRKWVKHARPKDARTPSGRGHKPNDWRAHLTRLAAMRLLLRHTALDIVADDKFPAVWKTDQFSRRKWLDVTKWHDARREAAKVFRMLFPFLPADEKPLSWHRQPPAK